MKEIVHCAHGQHDGTILSGIADVNGQPYYFSRLFDDGPEDNWTDVYELTLLSDEVFRLELQNWKYWLFWLDEHIQHGAENKILHPVHYADFRKTKDFNPNIFPNLDIARQAEDTYQNKLVIEEFLKNHSPTLLANAKFYGDRDGIDTQVEWTITNKGNRNFLG